jgi:hypothetical protein
MSMGTDETVVVKSRPSIGGAVTWVTATIALTAVTLLAGVGVAEILGQRGSSDDWSKWSDVGQTFGVVSSIFSGLALVSLVVTSRVQFREMRENRRELEQQRQSLAGNHLELQRAAEASVRRLHLEILKMSIEDPQLAEVWPAFEAGLSPERNRQYLYANIIYQFHWTSLRMNGYSEVMVLESLRYLFQSPIMREYWRAAANARVPLEPGSPEDQFARKVDELCRVYEAVVATAGRGEPSVEKPRVPVTQIRTETEEEGEAA